MSDLGELSHTTDDIGSAKWMICLPLNHNAHPKCDVLLWGISILAVPLSSGLQLLGSYYVLARETDVVERNKQVRTDLLSSCATCRFNNALTRDISWIVYVRFLLTTSSTNNKHDAVVGNAGCQLCSHK